MHDVTIMSPLPLRFNDFCIKMTLLYTKTQLNVPHYNWRFTNDFDHDISKTGMITTGMYQHVSTGIV